jgi:GAF domain-containing protein
MIISPERKAKRYKRIYLQLQELVQKTDNTIARMATISSVLYHKMDNFSWTGFYLLLKNELIVGPYQGPLACQMLEKNRGVCWKSINEQQSIIVPDVNKFPGHVACDPRSKSEIVIPVKNNRKEIIGVLDVDSNKLNNFDEIDALHLERIASLIFMTFNQFLLL